MYKGKLNVKGRNDIKYRLNINSEPIDFSNIVLTIDEDDLKKPKKRRVLKRSVLVFILWSLILGGFLLSYLKLFGVLDKVVDNQSSIVIGDTWGKYFHSNIVTDNNESFRSTVRKYFKLQYGLSVTVHNVENTVKDGVTNLKATVKLYGDNKDYTVTYTKNDKYVYMKENYGSSYTSKLLSERLKDLLKYKLPSSSSEIWVVANSLCDDEDIAYSDISDIIANWGIADIVSYNKANHLIEDINISILSSTSSNLNKYKSRILDIVTTLDATKEGVPKLNVGFFKGSKSRDYVYKDIAKRYGVSADDIDFTINWYDEIPKINKVKNYMWGAISISENATSVLNSYIDNKIDYYTVSDSDTKIPIYMRVTDLLAK